MHSYFDSFPPNRALHTGYNVGLHMVGVDPHKKRHVAVAMTQDFMVQSNLKFANSKRGFDGALERAKIEMVRTDCCGVIFAIETAGHCWCNLAYFLDYRDIPFRFINQFIPKRRRDGKDLKRRKNDFRHAEVAAQPLSTGEFAETKLSRGVYGELCPIYSTYRRLGGEDRPPLPKWIERGSSHDERLSIEKAKTSMWPATGYPMPSPSQTPGSSG